MAPALSDLSVLLGYAALFDLANRAELEPRGKTRLILIITIDSILAITPKNVLILGELAFAETYRSTRTAHARRRNNARSADLERVATLSSSTGSTSRIHGNKILTSPLGAPEVSLKFLKATR